VRTAQPINGIMSINLSRLINCTSFTARLDAVSCVDLSLTLLKNWSVWEPTPTRHVNEAWSFVRTNAFSSKICSLPLTRERERVRW
jgi:hypothetical protein